MGKRRNVFFCEETGALKSYLLFCFFCLVDDINIYIFAEATIAINTMKKYKVREVIKLLEADGWVQLKGSGGDHRQFKHPIKKGRVTVRGHESEVLNQFLLNSIWKQAGWK